MNNFRTFGKGFLITQKKSRMLIYLWLVNFVFSILVVTPLYFLLQRDFSRSLMGAQISRELSLIWLGDLIYKYREFYPAFIGWFLIPGLLFFLLYIFLNGGIIGRIASGEEKISMANFFADCGKYFFRFFRVFLISLVGYIFIFAIVLKILYLPFQLLTKNASTEWPLIISSNLKFIIAILFFSAARMFFDYIRVRLVVEKSKKTIKATLKIFSFMGRHFIKAWLLYLFVGLVVVVLGIIFIFVDQILPKVGLGLVLAFIWMQIYVLSRIWTKMLFFSTEYHFYRQRAVPSELE